MKFARVVFLIAGVWGIVVLTPLYFLVDLTGRQYVAPADYPQFFYGFLSVALAWQIAFLVIGSSPGRFRPLMIPSIVEKFGHVTVWPCCTARGASRWQTRRRPDPICSLASSLSWPLR